MSTQTTDRATGLRYAAKVFFSNQLSVVGALLVVLFVLIGILGPWLAPYPADMTDYSSLLTPPSSEHLFGTDQYGRDVLSRVVSGASISLEIGLVVITISTGIGILVGILSGYLGGRIDTFLMRLVDLFMAFPPVVVAMVLATMLGGGIKTLIIALSLSRWCGTARLARGEVLSVKNSGFIKATKAIGGSWPYIAWHHVLPNIIPPVLISSTLSFGRIVLSTAGLSFIGVGVQPPLPEWGTMICEGREYMLSGQWWLSFYPGAAIMITVMGLNLLGDGLRDILDPRQRR